MPAGKQVSVMKYEKKEIDDLESQNPLRDKWKNQQELLKNEEDIAESGRIFFRNLSYTTTEDDVQTLFSKYGDFFFAPYVVIFAHYRFLHF